MCGTCNVETNDRPSRKNGKRFDLQQKREEEATKNQNYEKLYWSSATEALQKSVVTIIFLFISISCRIFTPLFLHRFFVPFNFAWFKWIANVVQVRCKVDCVIYKEQCNIVYNYNKIEYWVVWYDIMHNLYITIWHTKENKWESKFSLNNSVLSLAACASFHEKQKTKSFHVLFSGLTSLSQQPQSTLLFLLLYLCFSSWKSGKTFPKVIQILVKLCKSTIQTSVTRICNGNV